MALVELLGLKSRPELNGRIAELVRAYPSKGRWEVRVDGETFGVKPSCMKPCEDVDLAKLRQQAVRLQGVASRAELNGAPAQCGPFLVDRGLWQVLLEDGSTILLRSDCLSHVDTGATFKDPVAVVEHGGFADTGSGMPQKALVAADRIRKGQRIFHEKPIIKVAQKDGWEAQCREFANAYLAADPAKQAACLAMFAEPDVRMDKKGSSWQRSGDMVKIFKKLGLHSTVPESEHENVWKFIRVMQSNCFESEDGGRALFIWLCRVNHSCCPNAVRQEHDGGKSLIALRDLAEGEDITITYLSDVQLLEPCVTRQRQVEFLGFKCLCGRCRTCVDDVRKFCCPKGCGSIDVITGNENQESFSVCTKCELKIDVATGREMLEHESAFVDGVLELDKNPFLLSSHPEYVEQLLTSGRGVFAVNHWAIAKIHGHGVNLCRQRKAFGEALDHAKAELEFWNHHLTRPSQVAAWKRKLRGDIAADKGDFMLALLEYSRAFAELNYVMIGGSYVEELRSKLRLALEFHVDAQVEPTASKKCSALHPLLPSGGLNLPDNGCPQQ